MWRDLLPFIPHCLPGVFSLLLQGALLDHQGGLGSKTQHFLLEGLPLCQNAAAVNSLHANWGPYLDLNNGDANACLKAESTQMNFSTSVTWILELRFPSLRRVLCREKLGSQSLSPGYSRTADDDQCELTLPS